MTSDADATLEIETLCRVIEKAQRWQTIESARRALQNVLRISDSMNAESRKHFAETMVDNNELNRVTHDK